MARPGFRAHPKFRRLLHILQIPEAYALGHCEMLWETAYQNGDPFIGDSLAVELCAGWLGTPGALTQALLDAGGDGRDGLIDAVDVDGAVCFQIHDLHENAPVYVTTRRAREESRKVPRICEQCQTAFHSSSRKASYCTPACRQAAYRDRDGARDDSRDDSSEKNRHESAPRDGETAKENRYMTDSLGNNVLEKPSADMEETGACYDPLRSVTIRDDTPAPAPAPSPLLLPPPVGVGGREGKAAKAGKGLVLEHPTEVLDSARAIREIYPRIWHHGSPRPQGEVPGSKASDVLERLALALAEVKRSRPPASVTGPALLAEALRVYLDESRAAERYLVGLSVWLSPKPLQDKANYRTFLPRALARLKAAATPRTPPPAVPPPTGPVPAHGGPNPAPPETR